MADFTKAELVAELEPRIRAVELAAARAEAAVVTLKWAMTTFLAPFLVVSITGLLAAIIHLEAAQAASAEKIAAIGKQHDTDVARLDKSIDRLTAQIEKQPSVKYASSLGISGQIVRILDDVLVIKADVPEGRELAILLPRDVKVSVGGKPAKVADLKPAMRVRVTWDENGIIQGVEEDLPPPAPPVPK